MQPFLPSHFNHGFPSQLHSATVTAHAPTQAPVPQPDLYGEPLGHILSDTSSTHADIAYSVAQLGMPNTAINARVPQSGHPLERISQAPRSDLFRPFESPSRNPRQRGQSSLTCANHAPSARQAKITKRSKAIVPVYRQPDMEDDRNGHLIYRFGDGLNISSQFPRGRYKILKNLGEGTFGKVVECWDRGEERHVAIKIVRSIQKYRQAAQMEIDVLLQLNTRDPNNTYHCVKFYSWFEYKSHVCMVFEKLGLSLYEQLRANHFKPFALSQVRDYAFQLLASVNFVHSLTLIHTDLKPENILMEVPSPTRASSRIKLIDFGSATYESQYHSPLISTRHYRAPEVILGLGWTYPVDLWSVGCILFELYTGQALFQTHENLEHLAMMSCVLGPIPDRMMLRAEKSGKKYFRVKGGRCALNWPKGASSEASIQSVQRVQTLWNIIRCTEHNEFFDLVKRLLTFEPETRCTSAEALQHPFFRNACMHDSGKLIAPPIRWVNTEDYVRQTEKPDTGQSERAGAEAKAFGPLNEILERRAAVRTKKSSFGYCRESQRPESTFGMDNAVAAELRRAIKRDKSHVIKERKDGIDYVINEDEDDLGDGISGEDDEIGGRAF